MIELLFVSLLAFAQTPSPPVTVTSGDVIEGTRKESPIFVQLDPNAVDRSILIFKRRDFNDFHELDRKRRLKYRAGGGAGASR